MFNPSTYSATFLTWGEGGGFAGIEKRFHVLPSGKVYQSSSLDSLITSPGKLDANLTTQIFDQIQAFDLNQYHYYQPGNRYFFLIPEGSLDSTRIVWAPGDEEVHPACLQIHQLLRQSFQAIQP
jgi:hypothetical protein